ncbi:hypothetical protein BDF19DRAFT_235366 [Syncephalis fuscata]|nr:hypothetical protein BDF19DRAFT_235366 [Syncephalis fuscata]
MAILSIAVHSHFSMIKTAMYRRFMLFLYSLSILLFTTSLLNVANVDASPSTGNFPLVTLSLNLGGQQMKLPNSIILLGNSSEDSQGIDTAKNGFLLPIKITRTENATGCFQTNINVTQLECDQQDSFMAGIKQLGLLVQPDPSVNALFAQNYPVIIPPSQSLPTSSHNSTQTPPDTKLRPTVHCNGQCLCYKTLEDALSRLIIRLNKAKCPPVQTIITLPSTKSNEINNEPPSSQSALNVTDSSSDPDGFSRQMAALTRQLKDKKEPGLSPDSRVIAVAPSPVTDRLMETTANPDMARAAALKFDFAIIDEVPTQPEMQELYTRGCRISGWIFFAIVSSYTFY